MVTKAKHATKEETEEQEDESEDGEDEEDEEAEEDEEGGEDEEEDEEDEEEDDEEDKDDNDDEVPNDSWHLTIKAKPTLVDSGRLTGLFQLCQRLGIGNGRRTCWQHLQSSQTHQTSTLLSACLRIASSAL